jgi:hypothetical protein
MARVYEALVTDGTVGNTEPGQYVRLGNPGARQAWQPVWLKNTERGDPAGGEAEAV